MQGEGSPIPNARRPESAQQNVGREVPNQQCNRRHIRRDQPHAPARCKTAAHFKSFARPTALTRAAHAPEPMADRARPTPRGLSPAGVSLSGGLCWGCRGRWFVSARSVWPKRVFRKPSEILRMQEPDFGGFPRDHPILVLKGG
jgi:hypothetical protein